MNEKFKAWWDEFYEPIPIYTKNPLIKSVAHAAWMARGTEDLLEQLKREKEWFARITNAGQK